MHRITGMAMYRQLCTLALLCASTLAVAPLSAQDVVITRRAPGNAAPDGAFGGFGATPISPTAVLHSYMEPAGTGAALGFAVAIRGPEGWYRQHTRWGDLPPESVPEGSVGQSWQVGERAYRLIYDPAAKTLTLFGETVSLESSRVVLVTLTDSAGARAVVQSGAPVQVHMAEPQSFHAVFLPKAPEVRSFAGIR